MCEYTLTSTTFKSFLVMGMSLWAMQAMYEGEKYHDSRLIGDIG